MYMKDKGEYRSKKELELNNIIKEAEKGIKEFMTSDKYIEYLNVMSKFHKYSFSNVVLIAIQKPDASLCAGFTTWKNQERYVKKGEKGISILAPCPYKHMYEEEYENPINGRKDIKNTVVTRMGYKIATVFDIGQTDGKEIPTICNELKGNAEELDAVRNAIEEITNIKIEYEAIRGPAKGYFSPIESRIAIQSGMSEMQQCKTIVHEGVHALLHYDIAKKIDKHKVETEAEATAYVVCKKFGIDTSDYSFPYLASWAGSVDLPDLKQSLKTIQETAMAIIDKIEQKIKEIELDKKDELTQEDIAVTILESNYPSIAKGDILSLEKADNVFKSINKEVYNAKNRKDIYEIKFAIKNEYNEIIDMPKAFKVGIESGGVREFIWTYLNNDNINKVFGGQNRDYSNIGKNSICKRNCIEIVESTHESFNKGSLIKFFIADDKFREANEKVRGKPEGKIVEFNGYNSDGEIVVSNLTFNVGEEVGSLASYIQRKYEPYIFKSLYSSKKTEKAVQATTSFIIENLEKGTTTNIDTKGIDLV